LIIILNFIIIIFLHHHHHYHIYRYSVSRATSADEAFYRYWEEVMIVLQTPERAMATVLLVFPEIELFGNYELFEAFCDRYGE